MRGKVPRSSVILDCVRITPAYAGKSDSKSAAALAVWDHPRLCGEKGGTFKSVINGAGSPPPMRGKDKLSKLFKKKLRITPAYAGKRMNVTESVISQQDHPRLCGEKSQTMLHDFAEKGSPPPMRGKGSVRSCTSKHQRDHPRLCGEKVFYNFNDELDMGSPPPMRGKD